MVRIPMLPVSNVRQFFEPVDFGALRELAVSFLSDQTIAEALELANPGFYQRVTGKLRSGADLDSGVVRAVLTFVLRMHTRATPFGLMASTSEAPLGKHLSVADIPQSRVWTRSRPDSAYLTRLAVAIQMSQPDSPCVKWRLNPTLYVVGGVVRYFSRSIGDGKLLFQLRELADDSTMATVRSTFAGERSIEQAVEMLVEATSVDTATAQEFVTDLIENQLLVANVEAPVTTSTPLEWLSRFSNATNTNSNEEVLTASHLAASFLDLDAATVGRKRPHVARTLDQMRTVVPGLPESSYAVQCDLYRDISGTIVPSEIGRSVADAATRLGAGTHVQLDWMSRFVEQFTRRFEDQEIPLLQAVDPDFGVDISASGPRLGHSLLDDLPLGDQTNSGLTRSSGGATLANAMFADLADSDQELVLPDDWRNHRSGRDNLPSSFSAMVRVVRHTESHKKANEYLIYCDAFRGPSAAAVFGRFCHPDDELSQRFKALAQVDSTSASPNEVVAEVCHLPQERAGNLMFRLSTHEAEIDCLGNTSVKSGTTIPLSDLLLSVRLGKVLLRSRSLNVWVRPRITSAFTFWISANLPVYRLLGFMQYQYGIPPQFSWGTAQYRTAFLPRVKWRNVVLSPKQWRLTPRQIAKLKAASSSSFPRELDALWIECQIDDWVYLVPDAVEDRRIACRRDSVTTALIVQRFLDQPATQWHFQEAPELSYTPLLATKTQAYSSELVIPLFCR